MPIPSCCTPTKDATLAERLYCAYNRAGDPKTAGLNYQGLPCPTWPELPENIRAKWNAVSEAAANIVAPDFARAFVKTLMEDVRRHEKANLERGL